MADSFAKISSIIESARDITLEAAVSASTRLTETPTAKRPQEISKLLSSRLDREVLHGIKCVVALISSGEDASDYFADVVKNVTSANPRVRALVMIYVEKYAELEPDTALLAINSVQKSLSDKTPNARSASIRTLGGIRIPEIGSLVLLCIKRTITDRSPEVRSATALAIGSAFRISGIQKPQLIVHLGALMADSSPLVVGTSVKVFVQLKPELFFILRSKTWAPVHANFKRYVRILHELDEWSKATMIDLLVEYCRTFIARPVLTLPDETKMDYPRDVSGFPPQYSCEMDPDLNAFVNALSASAHSESNLVVLSATRALISLATPQNITEFGFPRLLLKLAVAPKCEPEQLLTLQLISSLAISIPKEFEDHARKFYLHPQDSNEVSKCKLQILSSIFSDRTARVVMKELMYNASSNRREIAQNAVRAIGYCCQASRDWTDKILQWCLSEMENDSASLILPDLLQVIRYLLQQKQSQSAGDQHVVKTIYRLSLMLQNDHMHLEEDSKASIVWTIGEFTESTHNTVGPDVLRRSLKSYSQEPEKVRYELLLLAAKAHSYEIQNLAEEAKNNPFSIIGQIFTHVMHLARYDPATHTRDKARMLDELFKDASNHQLAYLFMQAPKAAPNLDQRGAHSVSLTRYLCVSSWADPSTIPPSSVRKDISRAKSSIGGFGNDSTNSVSTTSISDIIAEKTLKSSVLNRPVSSSVNRLQSLDEFFGDEEESEVSGEEEDDSLDHSSVSESETDQSAYGSDSDDSLLEH